MFKWLFNLVSDLDVTLHLTRVVERQMDGCQAAYIDRESYGTVIATDRRFLHPSGNGTLWWLIRWDEDGSLEWYPALFFKLSWRDPDGTWVRTC